MRTTYPGYYAYYSSLDGIANCTTSVAYSGFEIKHFKKYIDPIDSTYFTVTRNVQDPFGFFKNKLDYI